MSHNIANFDLTINVLLYTRSDGRSFTLNALRNFLRCSMQLRFAYYMRGHHVFQLTMHIVERPDHNQSDLSPESYLGGQCRGQKIQNFTDHWSKIMLATSRPKSATWTTVSVPLPHLRCR